MHKGPVVGIYVSTRRQPKDEGAEKRGEQVRELGWGQSAWGLGSPGKGVRRCP